MFVKDKMTKNPITIFPNDVISSALDIFKEHDFHRLPVVNENNELVGLITESVLSEHVPSKATSLSIHELNYLLNKETIEDVMIKKVFTISPDALLEEAADLMVKNRVYSLPVIENKKVVGMITQKDIFQAFIAVQGFYNSGTRLVVSIDEDKPGILKRISTILTEENINITHLVVERYESIYVVIRVDDTDSDRVANLLKDEFKIIDVRSFNC